MKKLTQKEKKERKRVKARLQANYQEAISKLHDCNPIEHMRHINKLNHDIRSYFYRVSPVWLAIEEHIGNTNIETCAVIQLEGRVAAQGGSNALSFNNWSVYHESLMFFRVEFTVDYYDNYQDYYNYDTFTRTYSLSVPIDLELNFTKKAFNTWVKEIKAKRDEETQEKDLKELDRLKKLYPRVK